MGQYARIRESSLMVTDKDKLLSFLREKSKGDEFYLRLSSENKWKNEDDELFWRLKFEFPVKDFLSIDDDGILDFCSIGEYDEDSWKTFAPYLKGYIEWDGEGVELWRDVFDGNGNIKQYYPEIIWSKEAVCNDALPLTDQKDENITGQKIVIPIAGIKSGLCLTVEASTDPDYPCEVYAGITTPEGVWLQNVAYICQEYAYGEEDIEYKNSFSVKAFSSPFSEDPDRNLSGLEITDNLSLKSF